MERKLSEADCEKIRSLYFKVFCLFLSRKEITRLAENDIKRRKYYERP